MFSVFWTLLHIDYIHHLDFWLIIATAICCDTDNSMDLVTDWPSLQDIITEWHLLLTTRCNCLHNNMGIEDQKLCMTHLAGLARKMTCENILYVHAYYSQEHSWPTTAQLENFITNIAAITEDMSTYCIDNDVKTPTPHLNRLAKKKNVTQRFCSICQSMAHTNTDVYELPCGHVFHADGAECLGSDHTILHWLHSHKTCPTCNVEVVIPSY